MVKVERLENNEALLTITISAEDFSKAVDAAFEKAVKEVEVKGFRKGKCPRSHFEKLYGVESLYGEAVNNLINSTYPKAAFESGLEIVSDPELDLDFASLKVGSEMVYTAKVTLKPEVKLGEYKGIKVLKQSTVVTDEDVENEIKRLLSRKSELVEKEGDTLENGDVSIIDYEGFVGDEAFAGGKAENAELTIGSGQFIPGFEEGMIGMKKGETRDVLVTFPTEYHASELAGKEAKFVVTLHEIKVRVTPELTDELASELDKEANTKELFTEKVRNNLQDRKNNASENKIVDDLVVAVTKNAELSVPTVMVDQEVNRMVEDTEARAKQYGLDLNTFLGFNGTDLESYKENLEPQALTAVKQRLVLEAIAKAEDLKASAELIEKTYNDLASMYNMSVEDIKKNLPEQYLSVQLVPTVTIDFLKENASIDEE